MSQYCQRIVDNVGKVASIVKIRIQYSLSQIFADDEQTHGVFVVLLTKGFVLLIFRPYRVNRTGKPLEQGSRFWEEGRFSGLVKSGKVGHDNHSYKEFCHGFAPPPLSQRIQDQCCSPRAVEGRRACDVADELGIGRQTLYSWLHEARTGVLSGTSENAREITPQEAEIARLKSELARKEQEILLLKKFAAYLSSTGLK